MKCPKCTFNNPKGSKYCNQCGVPLLIPSTERDHLRFAQSYIPQLLRNKISSARIEGEIKNVTVLFADISGFTALSEKLDPEEITELINNCFKVLIEVIYRYEGTIDKFIGDCIMAIFGAPLTHEDDPERAVHTSLEMMAALNRFNEKHGENLSIHIGINSGVVIAGGVGSDLRMDYTVMGDTVNLAQRLLGQAKDEILVSESVYRKTNYLFKLKGLAPVKVKGKSKKIKPYRVIGIKEKPKIKRGIPGLYSPLVGRDKEFETLKLITENLLKGKPGAVSIIGEAGLGKSRLIEEIRKYVGEKVTCLRGRALSFSKTLSFGIFLDQIRSYLDISKLDLELDARKKLREKTKKLFKKKINEYYPYLCLFLSINVPENLKEKVKYLDPESLRLQVFVSVKALFRELSRREPLILYFEDMHWIDPESLELITFLLDGLKDSTILFLFETRPEKETGLYRIKNSIKNAFKKRYTEIRLKPLSTDNAYVMVLKLLKITGFPHNISSLILEKSQGNPFYIEEIIRSFIDAGILKKKNGVWNFEKDPSFFEIPDTVEAVISSRVDRLPVDAKQIVGKASVIGNNFHYRILSCISEKNKLESSLNVLENKEFIMKKSSATLTLLQDLEYIFKHILIKDVAYKGLLKKKRRQIHKKTAECIENIFKGKMDDYLKILAHHYYYAEILKTSYNYYKRAGDKAKELYRNDSAIECYTKAIEIHNRIFQKNKKEEKAELFERRGDVKKIKAEYDDALVDCENALKNYLKIEKKANVKRKIGEIFFKKGEYDSAVSFYDEAIAMLKNYPSSSVLSETRIFYAWFLSVRKSEHSRAEKMTKDALVRIDKVKNLNILAKGLHTLGGISYNRGNYDKALEYYHKTLTTFETLVDKKGIGGVSNNIGLVYRDKGELDTALQYIKKYLSISEKIGDKRGIGIASNNIGLVYHDKGELDKALKYYERHLTISEEIGYKRGVAIASGNIGIIYRKKGEFDTALKFYERYRTISKEIGFKHGICLACSYIGVVHRYRSEIDEALNYFKSYLAISEEIWYKIGIGDAYLSIGIVHMEIEDIEHVETYLEKAKSIFTELGDKRFLSKVYTNLSELSIYKKDYESALKLSKKALSLARKIGAKEQEISALREMGKVLAEKNPAKAITYLKKSITLVRKEHMDLELAKSLYILAKIQKNSGKKKDAKENLIRSKRIFQKAGAKRWLKMIDDTQS